MAEQPRPDDDNQHRPDPADKHGGGAGDKVPDLPPEWASIVIPDDARELTAEVEALRRERRRDARRAWMPRLFPRPRYGLSGPLIALSVLIAGVFSSLIFLLPTGPASPRQQRLGRPTAPAGSVGGLLPDVRLSSSTGSTVRTRDLRPAVVLVLPKSCACAALIDEIVTDTTTGRLAVLVVTEGSSAPRPLPNNAPRERITSVADPASALDRALALAAPSSAGSRSPMARAGTASSARAAIGPPRSAISPEPQPPVLPPTGVFVRSDGKINSVLTDVQDRQNLSGEIIQLID